MIGEMLPSPTFPRGIGMKAPRFSPLGFDSAALNRHRPTSIVQPACIAQGFHADRTPEGSSSERPRRLAAHSPTSSQRRTIIFRLILPNGVPSWYT